MKRKMLYNIKLLVLCFMFLFSFSVFAQNGGQPGNITDPNGGQAGLTTQASGQDNSIKLTNPLVNTNDIPTLVEKILEIALKIGVPLIALAIIYTGYLFIAAQGKPEKLTEAKQALVWVVVGAAILLGAYVIAQALVGTIDAIRGN